MLGLEAVGRFGTDTRTLLFYLFATVCAVAVRYLLLPGLRLLRLRSGLDHDTAARIIGRHFPGHRRPAAQHAAAPVPGR